MKEIHESDKVQARKERVSKFFQSKTVDRPLVYLCPLFSYSKRRGGTLKFTKREFEDWNVMLQMQHEMVNLVLDTDNDNVPYLWPYTAGMHFTASLFGCRVQLSEDGIFWLEPLQLDFGKDSLPQPDLSNSTMQKVIEEMSFLQEQTGYSLPIALPESSSPINAASDILGSQELLMQTALDPHKVKEFAMIVADTIVSSIKKLSEQVKTEPVYSDRKSWLPPQYKMLLFCNTQMISAVTYESVFREADEHVLQEFDGGIVHICGNSTHLIPVLRDMKKIKGVEIQGWPGVAYNASGDYEKYFDGLREDQIIILYTEGMDVEKVLERTGGRRIIFRVTEPAQAVKIRAWCEMHGIGSRQ